jgi:hypothetical protein
MNAHDLFGVAVRSIGLWLFANAVSSMTTLLAAPQAILIIAANLIVGAILFFGADGFVRTAYNRTRQADTT